MSIFFKIIVFLFISAPIFSLGLRYNNDVEFLFVILAILSSFLLFYKNDKAISLLRIFSLFFAIFLTYAPIVQFRNNIVFFGSREYKDEDYIFSNILLILVFLVIFISYNIFFRFLKKKPFKINLHNNVKIKSLKKTTILLFISFLCFCIVFASKGFNLYALFFRGLNENNNDSLEVGVLWLVVNYFIRPMPIIILLFILHFFKRSYKILFLFTLIALLTDFPTSMARFSVAAMYMPLMLYVFKSLHKKYVFQSFFLGSLFIIFPFLDNFRHFSTDKKISFSPNLEMFKEGHFDTYQSILNVTSHEFITNGNQILGVMFFWFPRSLWHSKPIGSGAFLAKNSGFTFTNVSCNFFAEGYINFGIYGAILFSLILGLLMAKLDFLYQNKCYKNQTFIVSYYLLLGFLFFILRGDLLSSFAYLCGFLSAVKFISKIVFK